MTGYFQNAGKTLREGIEAKINYKLDRWNAYANYTYVERHLSERAHPVVAQSTRFADANGNIFVAPGDHIPAHPRATASRPASNTPSPMHGSSAPTSTSSAASG